MAFCFKRKESVAKAIRRLGRERTEEALTCLKDCDQPEAIHCARQNIKKTRAVLKLVRGDVSKKAFSRKTKLLRAAADHLAPTRDAYIVTKALKDLTSHFRGQLAPGALRHIRMPLQTVLEDQTKQFSKEKTAAKRLLRRATREFDDVSLDRRGWKALGAGVKTSYRKGRQNYCIALADPKPEKFHEWRTSVKDLRYQVRLLRRMWPEQMDAVAEELEALGEFLGDDHDLFMLQQAVVRRPKTDGHARELETLKGLIQQRQAELRAAALELGERFYAEKPSVFCKRLGGYWHIWRRKKKSSASLPLLPA